VEMCGLTSAERLPRAREIAARQNGVFIPPYDPYIMAGQGTAGLEILEQVDEVDAIFVPIGGGGLIAGILTTAQVAVRFADKQGFPQAGRGFIPEARAGSSSFAETSASSAALSKRLSPAGWSAHQHHSGGLLQQQKSDRRHAIDWI